MTKLLNMHHKWFYVNSWHVNYSDKGCRLEQGYLVFLMSVCFAAYHLENKLIIIIIIIIIIILYFQPFHYF